MHFHILWLSITQLQIRQSERPRAYLYLLQSVLQFGIQFTVETKKKLTIIFKFLYHKKKNSSISYYIYIFNRLENIAEVVELVLHKKRGKKTLSISLMTFAKEKQRAREEKTSVKAFS